jgi:hypothetical protein
VERLILCLQAAALDPGTRFRRLYALPDGAELLAVVTQAHHEAVNGSGNGTRGDSEEVVVALTTDAPNDIVLHWGVGTTQNRSWQLPPADIWKGLEGSEKDGGGALLGCFCVITAWQCEYLRGEWYSTAAAFVGAPVSVKFLFRGSNDVQNALKLTMEYVVGSQHEYPACISM